MKLRYHQRALEIMGIEPVFSEERIRILEEWEREYQRALPAALKELYALEGIEEWFRQANQDFLKPIDCLFLDDWSEIDEDEVECVGLSLKDLRQGTVHFFCENQGVVNWEVLMNGSNDPPVVIDSFNVWMIACPRLSDFFLAVAWDHALLCDDNVLWGAVDYKKVEEVKDRLFAQFEQLPVTYGWTTERAVLRFQKENWRVSLHDEGHGDAWIAGWKNEKELEELMRLVCFHKG
jgi:hypothetical protein